MLLTMRSRIFLHVVWTTRDREPIIGAEGAGFLSEYLPRIASEERAKVLGLGIVTTHLHMLVRVHPTTVLPRLVQRWKGGSATVAKRDHQIILKWDAGYNVESVSVRALSSVMHYVTTQDEHHPDQAIAIPSPASG